MKKLFTILIGLAVVFIAPSRVQAQKFSDFTAETSPASTDHLVGYRTAGVAGGNRKFTLATLSTYFQTGYSTTATVNGWFADPSTNGSFSASAWRTDLALVIGTNVQAYDADLTTYAGITPSANVQSLLGAADYAAMRGLLDLETGTDFLAYPTGTPTGSKYLRDDNSWQVIAGGGDALVANPLTQFTGILPTNAEFNFVDGVTSAIQTQLDAKAPLAGPTFTGTVTIPTPFTIGAVSVLPTGTELNYVDGVTSAIQTQLDAKAPLASPTFTGTPSLPTGTTATTQSPGDNSTKLATTAYADAAGGVTASSTTTLTNKRITLRIATLTDAATVTPATDSYDGGILTTLSQATLIANPTGTPTEGQKYTIRIKSTTTRALTYGSQFRGSADLALPSATSGSSLTDYLVFQWNVADSKWDILGRNFGF